MIGFNSLQTGKCIQRNGSRVTNLAGESFNSLQTGKCIQRLLSLSLSPLPALCFNSLQTGKCIQSATTRVCKEQGRARVSIPFKRESVFREKGDDNVEEEEGFNSLQTGKCIQSDEAADNSAAIETGFNSLQTGKCIQRQ